MTIFRLTSVLWVLLWAQGLFAGEGIAMRQKLVALQQAFCGQQKQDEITERIQKMVEERAAALSPEARAKQPAVAELVTAIKEQIWTTFHVHALCLEKPVLERAKITGSIHGYFFGSFIQDFGFQTLIHEGGHAAMASMFYVNANPEVHVVKFEVFVRFCKEVFSGNGNLASFGELLSPGGGFAASGDGVVKGWMTYHTASGLTSSGAAIGATSAEAAILLGGVIFTSLAQMIGLIVGIHLKDTHPFLGYTLIVASASTYLVEMINWFALAAAAQTGAAASSDLARVSLLLGISNFAVPGIMLGVSAAVIVTYVSVHKYLQHRRNLRISTKSLLNEGVLSVINGKNEKMLDALWTNYPRKEEFDAVINKMADHMEKDAAKNIERQVKALAFRLTATEEEIKASATKSFSDYLPDRNTFITMWENFKRNRLIKAFKSELRSFHQYIGDADESIDLSTQDEQANAAINKILQGKFLSEKDGWFSTKPVALEEREKRVTNYRETHPQLPLHKLVTANVLRVKFNEKLAKHWSKLRWQTVVSEDEFKQLKARRSWWFSLRHLTYTFFKGDFDLALQNKLLEFAKYKDDNDMEGIQKASKHFLRDVLFVPKEHRNIAAAAQAIGSYVQAVQKQQREKFKKRWLLDVVDEASCKIEVDFVCSMGAMMMKDKLAEGEIYSCPLSVPASCGELNEGKGLLRSVFEPVLSPAPVAG
jgi:hypothetical protein